MARRLAVLFLALMATGSAACSTTTSSSSPTTTTASPTVPSTQATTTTTTTTTAPVGPMCGNGQIAVSIQTSYVGAGSAAEELGFLNVSKSLCTLHGYPGAAALNLQGHQIAQAERSDIDGGLPTDVTLSPGQLGEALIQGSDGSALKCSAFTRSFLVTAPNMTQSTQVVANGTSAAIGVSGACLISIGPVSPETPQPTAPSVTSTSAPPAPASTRCQTSDLKLAIGFPVSEKTQQHSVLLTITNIGSTACSLNGYPGITLYDATGQLLDLSYQRKGDQEVTSAAPQLVNLAVGATGYVLINKNVCVGQQVASASTLRFIPPDDTTSTTLALTLGGLTSCTSADDPGSVLDISPVEPTENSTLAS